MRHFLLGVGVCLLALSMKAQSVSPENVRLAAVCRAWGFLKYYHPGAQSPVGFWDTQLMNAVRDSFAVRSDADASYVITKWLQMLNSKQPLGKPLPERIWSQRESRNFNPPWYEQGNIFRDPLNSNLQQVWKCKRKNELYNVAYGDNMIPVFLNEQAFPEWQYPNEAARVLTVARLWNALNYFYSYASQSLYPMNQLLEEAIQAVREAKDAPAYHFALWTMLGNLNNPNIFMDSEVLAEKFGTMYLPLKCFYENGKLLVTGYYEAPDLEGTDIRVGDIITEVDGVSIDSIMVSRYPRWHKYTMCDQYRLGALALMGNQSVASVKVIRGEDVSNKVVRRVQKLTNSKGAANVAWRRVDANTGFVHMEVVGPANVKQVMDSVFTTKKVIVDLRNDAGIEPELLAKYLCKDKVNYHQLSRAEMSSPGYFVDGEMDSWGRPAKVWYTGTVVLLVNENSSERSLQLASRLAYLPNATVVGSCVAGWDADKMSIVLPGNITVLVSGLGHYGAGSESKLHGAVQIDKQAIPQAADLVSGKDVLNAKAMEP